MNNVAPDTIIDVDGNNFTVHKINDLYFYLEKKNDKNQSINKRAIIVLPTHEGFFNGF